MPTGQYCRRPAANRFLDKVKQGPGCWEWAGAVGTHGYGRFGVKNKTVQAHRYSFELFHGTPPADLWVLHQCDNRLCVNPDHLFLGDRQANVDDCVSKLRHACGERHSWSKLRQEDVSEIRRLYQSGNFRQSALAKLFQTSASNISCIISKKSWRSAQ